jgi:hypothetical protein
MYETDDSLQYDAKSPLYFFQQRGKIANIQTTVFGGKLAYHGFGDKYQTLKPLLEVADKNKLVILADARDVILNVPDNEAFASLAVDNFVETYKKLTADAPNAVVLSAEAQCCVSAMAHAHPSEYFDPITKERKSRACSSGNPDCRYYPSPNIEDWQVFMEDLAFNTTGEDLSDVYLNAGLMVGYPDDLINLLNVLNIDPTEDDQAVLSGLMYQFPDMIKLDYRQEMFGNNQWPRGLVDGCVFEPQGKHLSLIHTEAGTEPLILHTPGKFYDCLDVLIEDLGGVSQQRYLFGLDHMNEVATNKGFTVTSDRDEVAQRRALQSNYFNYNYGGNYGNENYSPFVDSAYMDHFYSYYWPSYRSDNYQYGNYFQYGGYGGQYGPPNYANDGSVDHSQRRRKLSFFSRVHTMVDKIKAKLAGMYQLNKMKFEALSANAI